LSYIWQRLTRQKRSHKGQVEVNGVQLNPKLLEVDYRNYSPMMVDSPEMEGHSGTECGSRDWSGGRQGCGFLWLGDPRLIGAMLSEKGPFDLVSKPAGFHSG